MFSAESTAALFVAVVVVVTVCVSLLAIVMESTLLTMAYASPFLSCFALQSSHASTGRYTLEIYLSAWLLEPYIDSTRLAFIERALTADQTGTVSANL